MTMDMIPMTTQLMYLHFFPFKDYFNIEESLSLQVALALDNIELLWKKLGRCRKLKHCTLADNWVKL
jgi:hypothetical protein